MLKSKKNWLFSSVDHAYTSTEEVIEQYYEHRGLTSAADKKQYLKVIHKIKYE